MHISILTKMVIEHYKTHCAIYCGNTCMINRIWGVKQQTLQVNGHACFHLYICSAELLRTGRERKTQNKNVSPA